MLNVSSEYSFKRKKFVMLNVSSEYSFKRKKFVMRYNVYDELKAIYFLKWEDCSESEEDCPAKHCKSTLHVL